MLPRIRRVRRVRRDTRDTFTLEIEPADGEPEPGFLPGQFNMLYVFGTGEIPISISGDPQRPRPLVHTVRAVGKVSAAICGMARGDYIGVRGPFGSSWPVVEAEGSDVVLVAGGIGLAPLRPALYHVLAHRERYGRVVLLYGARTPRDMLYRKELERWRGRFDLEVEAIVDAAGAEWLGEVGVVTELIPRATFDLEQSVAMICGPEVMMHFTIRSLRSLGLSPDAIYVSMERSMKCGIGLCGHCQWGPKFVCKDGPVFRYGEIEPLMSVREL
jgi:NAD(P)H-flavin reductase